MPNIHLNNMVLIYDREIKTTWLKSPWSFLKLGFRDFKTNIMRTWPIIVAFIAYLFSSASILYGLLRVSAQIPSWLQALYSTWVTMSTAGELTTKSSKWVWALGAANSFVGILFFGFIVWLVTTSLYQVPDSSASAAGLLEELSAAGLSKEPGAAGPPKEAGAAGPPQEPGAASEVQEP